MEIGTIGLDLAKSIFRHVQRGSHPHRTLADMSGAALLERRPAGPAADACVGGTLTLEPGWNNPDLDNPDIFRWLARDSAPPKL